MDEARPTRSRADITSEEVFDIEKNFADLGLDDRILEALDEIGFEHPTHVQSKLVPAAISGRDILGQSKTGTGKTAAFGLPVLHRLLQEDDPVFGGLILCPTRELAIQVTQELRTLAKHTKLRIVPIYGGQRMTAQIPKLERGPHLIVGTPGRVMDFNGRGLLPYKKCKIAVLDEVDRMLDIGFREDIRRILGAMRHEHQTIFVSATVSQDIEKLARQYLDDPEKLTLTAASSLTVSRVDQLMFSVEPWDKTKLLIHLMKREKPELAIVFCRTKRTVDTLTKSLNKRDIRASAIHGDLQQGKRNSVMKQLRSGEMSVLIASDLAARGLDVDDITHVVNFDLPEDPEVYVHRIGRTARAGRKGIAWSFAAPGQGQLVMAIEKLTNVHIEEGDLGEFEPGPVPDRVKRERAAEVERRETAMNSDSRSVKAPPTAAAADDASRFPMGIVPTSVKSKQLRGRLRTRRR